MILPVELEIDMLNPLPAILPSVRNRMVMLASPTWVNGSEDEYPQYDIIGIFTKIEKQASYFFQQ